MHHDTARTFAAGLHQTFRRPGNVAAIAACAARSADADRGCRRKQPADRRRGDKGKSAFAPAAADALHEKSVGFVAQCRDRAKRQAGHAATVTAAAARTADTNRDRGCVEPGRAGKGDGAAPDAAAAADRLHDNARGFLAAGRHSARNRTAHFAAIAAVAAASADTGRNRGAGAGGYLSGHGDRQAAKTAAAAGRLEQHACRAISRRGDGAIEGRIDDTAIAARAAAAADTGGHRRADCGNRTEVYPSGQRKSHAARTAAAADALRTHADRGNAGGPDPPAGNEPNQPAIPAATAASTEREAGIQQRAGGEIERTRKAAPAAAAADALQRQAIGFQTCGFDIDPARIGNRTAITRQTAGAAHARRERDAASGQNHGTGHPAIAATAADRLGIDAVGIVAAGPDAHIAIQRDIAACAAIAPVTANRNCSGEAGTEGKRTGNAAIAAAAADRLRCDRSGGIASGDHAGRDVHGPARPRLRRGQERQGDIAPASAATAIAAQSQRADQAQHTGPACMPAAAAHALGKDAARRIAATAAKAGVDGAGMGDRDRSPVTAAAADAAEANGKRSRKAARPAATANRLREDPVRLIAAGLKHTGIGNGNGAAIAAGPAFTAHAGDREVEATRAAAAADRLGEQRRRSVPESGDRAAAALRNCHACPIAAAAGRTAAKGQRSGGATRRPAAAADALREDAAGIVSGSADNARIACGYIAAVTPGTSGRAEHEISAEAGAKRTETAAAANALCHHAIGSQSGRADSRPRADHQFDCAAVATCTARAAERHQRGRTTADPAAAADALRKQGGRAISAGQGYRTGAGFQTGGSARTAAAAVIAERDDGRVAGAAIAAGTADRLHQDTKGRPARRLDSPGMDSPGRSAIAPATACTAADDGQEAETAAATGPAHGLHENPVRIVARGVDRRRAGELGEASRARRTAPPAAACRRGRGTTRAARAGRALHEYAVQPVGCGRDCPAGQDVDNDRAAISADPAGAAAPCKVRDRIPAFAAIAAKAAIGQRRDIRTFQPCRSGVSGTDGRHHIRAGCTRAAGSGRDKESAERAGLSIQAPSDDEEAVRIRAVGEIRERERFTTCTGRAPDDLCRHVDNFVRLRRVSHVLHGDTNDPVGSTEVRRYHRDDLECVAAHTDKSVARTLGDQNQITAGSPHHRVRLDACDHFLDTRARIEDGTAHGNRRRRRHGRNFHRRDGGKGEAGRQCKAGRAETEIAQ